MAAAMMTFVEASVLKQPNEVVEIIFHDLHCRQW
jgi:hypothetical protein